MNTDRRDKENSGFRSSVLIRVYLWPIIFVTIQIPYGTTVLQPGMKLPVISRDAQTVRFRFPRPICAKCPDFISHIATLLFGLRICSENQPRNRNLL